MKVYEKMVVTTSWDDGHPLDIEIAKMLKKYHLNGTFYIPIRFPGFQIMDEKDIIKISENFEIGAHTFSHVDLTSIPFTQVRKELLLGKKKLEDVIKKRVVMLAYPRGYYNPTIVKIVKNIGFIGARTTESFRTTCLDPFRMGVTLQARPYTKKELAYSLLLRVKEIKLKYFIFKKILQMLESWEKLAILLFNYVHKNGGVFHLWGHSWEIEQYKMWDLLDNFLSYISRREGIAYVYNSDVARRLIN